MIHEVAGALREHPELALFLTLGLGYGAGRLRLGRFQPGPVVGVLLAGIAVGQLDIPVSADLRATFFLLFLFSVGYKAGPQFFHGLRSSGVAQAGLAVLFSSVGLAMACLLARAFGFDAGTAGGLVAGGLTEPAALGTAGDALAALPLADAGRQALQEKLTVAFAVTFVVGLVTAVGMISVVGPRLLGGDLAEACRRLEEELGSAKHEPGVVSAYRVFELRAYTVPEALDGRTAEALETLFAPERVFVERVRRRDAVEDCEPGTTLRAGDHVALSGRREVLVSDANPLRGDEVEDRALLDVPAIALDAVVTRRDLDGRTLTEVAELVAREAPTRGVFVRRITRAGQELPSGPHVVLQRGDALTLVGAQRHVERVAARVGFVERPSAATDVAVVGGAIALGGLLGLPALRLGGVELALSLPVGVLAGGLLTGWLRSLHPVFGRIPEPALWVFDSFGLAAFLALVGLEAGPGFAQGLQESGLALVGAAVLVCAVPHTLTMLVGRYVLGLHPGVVLGICAGAGTSMPGLAALQDVARSRVPTLGFGVSYAIGNVLLVLSGTAIVALTAR